MAPRILPLLCLLFGSPAEAEPSEYEGAVAELGAAIEAVDFQAPSVTAQIHRLEDTIEAVSSHPEELVEDLGTRDALITARILLISLYVSDHNMAAAEAAMSDAIRSGADYEDAARGLLDLYRERKDELESQGSAVIEVDCGEIDCELIVNERRLSNPTDPLYLGSYRVWIGARERDAPWEYQDVHLGQNGETRTLVYRYGIVEDDVTDELDPLPPSPAENPPEPRGRMLPRWLEILGMSAGVGLAVGGAVMLAYDGKCQNGNDPTDAMSCPEVYTSALPGYVMLGVGGGVFLLSGVMLTVDEVRGGGGKKGHRAMLSYTLRF